MLKSLFCNKLQEPIRHGTLTVTFPDGTSRRFGTGHAPQASITLTKPRALRRLILRPGLALGECYMDGSLIVADEDLVSLFEVLIPAQTAGAMPPWVEVPRALRSRLALFLQRNTPFSARRNVAHHYDISDDLYRLFLDADMQYSCAYFPTLDTTLEQAQAAKKRHLAGKLLLQPGMRVLDIGCGWGGLALTLARDYDVHVTGVTLSENQLATAKARAKVEGLEQRVDFRLLDYRLLAERFDRIVSVGMLEHVGVPQFGAYFQKVHDLLIENGVAVIHSIVKSGPPRPNNAWIEKYIFPGSYAPSASETYTAIENSWLYQCDDEALRLHYALTLRHWRLRFEDAHGRVETMFDARFVRMFRFYLASMEVSFRIGCFHVQQWQLAKRMDAVPITRDYLYPDAQKDWMRAAE